MHVFRDRLFPRHPFEPVEIQKIIVQRRLVAGYVFEFIFIRPILGALSCDDKAGHAFNGFVERVTGRTVDEQRSQGQVQGLYENRFQRSHAGHERYHRFQRDGHIAAGHRGHFAVDGFDRSGTGRDQRQDGVQNETELNDLRY